MVIKLHFLRHGETDFSQTGGFCGTTDAELTAEGKEMARQFASAYDKIAWESIYCSPFKRAIETARPLSDKLGLELRKRDGLREINYGAWEGLSLSTVIERYESEHAKWVSEPGWNAPTGGETAYEIASRSMQVIREITESHERGNVLVVSHKATIRIMLCNLLGIELGRYRDRINVLTASLSMIKFDEHGPMLELLGDRSHLSLELRNRPGT